MPVYTNALAPQPANSLAYGPRNLMGTQMLRGPDEAYLRQQFPGLYGFLGGVVGTAPDQMVGSVLDPNTAAVRQGAEYGFPVGTALGVSPLSPVALRGAAATGRFVAPKAGQLAEQYMVRTGGILPLDVYHGSPHKLPPTAINPLGEFDASKIGTGAGAQVRGYGIYTSESPEFAGYYAMQRKTPDVEGIASQNGLQLSRDAQVELMRQSTRDVMGKPTKGDNYIDPVAAARKLQNASIEARQMPAEQLQNTIREFQEQNRAYLYKADLPDKMIPKMLDYDKHLSEQSAEVQKILLPFQKEIGTSFGTGQQILKEIGFQRRMQGLDDSPAAVAQQLKDMGIPGVVYKELDTRNFVTFPSEEKNMKILERRVR